MDARDPFRYRNQLKGTSFRLLKLHADDHKSLLNCNLQEYAFGGSDDGARAQPPPVYDALSYTWNEEVPTQSVICNDKELLITPNLHQALLRIRQNAENTFLWVDAICINQSDVVEKTAQVRRMTEIFSKACRVVVWLGEEGPETARVFQLISQLYELEPRFREPHIDKNVDLDVEAFGLPQLTDSVWEDLFDLLSRPWFYRVWIIQEIAVASAGMFYCGNHQVSMLAIFSVTSTVTRFDNIHRVFELSGREPQDSQPRGTTAGVLGSIRTGYMGQYSLLVLSHLLRITKLFRSTDPRDKVFALVGISRDTSVDFIDYEQPLSAVNIEATKICLQGYNQFDLLGMVGGTYNPGSLPSWVPDWSLPTLFVPMANIYRQDPFSRPAGVNFRVDDNNALYVTGKVVDTVKNAIQQTPNARQVFTILGDVQQLYKYAAELEAWYQECENLVNMKSTYVDGSSMEQSFGRSTVFDTDHRFQHHVEGLYEAYQASRQLNRLLTARHHNGTSRQKRVVELVSLGKAFRRDVVMISFAVTSAASYLATSFWCKNLPKNTSQWLRATTTYAVGLATLYLMLMLCPHAISGDEADAEDLDQKIVSLIDASKSASFASRRFPFGRKFFASNQCVIGWVPNNAQPGDQICLFQGYRIPFLLRKHHDGYHLLGDCYLQSLMEGAAWNFYSGSVEEIKLV